MKRKDGTATPNLKPAAPKANRKALSRRRFLGMAGTSAAALTTAELINCKATWASDAPETPDLRFGIIALTDNSPIVIAHEKGFFKKYGINSTVAKGANWAAIRDSLSNGDIQATHMLIGMPIASTMGLLGSPKKPMVIPWLLNRNGQSITLKAELKGKVAADPKALKPLVMDAKAKGTPMTFAMTFPPGTHAMWMRYWLGAGGINPDKDVALITIPPPQMVANMKVGKMDGFCVGEPWNARAIADGIGFTALNTQDIWKDHPEKVCAFTAEFADKNPKTVKAVLKALHEASVWLDNMKNRPEQAEIVSRATYINCPKEIILGRMQGNYDFGDGRKKQDPNYMIFSQPQLQLPAAQVRQLVAHAVPALGHGDRHARLQGRRQAGHAHRHLRRGDEGDRLQARRPGRQPGDALRRQGLRSQEPREFASRPRRQQPEGLSHRP